MTHVLTFLLAFSGFVMLALAMKRHQRAMIGRQLSDRESRVARTSGSLAIIASLSLAAASFGFAYGAVAWLGHLSVASWAVVTMLIWRTRTR
jgi:hypothetical protein